MTLLSDKNSLFSYQILSMRHLLSYLDEKRFKKAPISFRENRWGVYLRKPFYSSSLSEIKEKVVVESEFLHLGSLGLFRDLEEFMLEEFSLDSLGPSL